MVAAVLLGLLVTTQPAYAHALVEKTTPAADETVERSPENVTMTFSEPVEVEFGGIRVFDSNAGRVDTGITEHVPGAADAIRAGLEGDLPDGTYTVTWRVVSADGHPISEAFVFHVGAPGERPEGIAADVLGEGSGTFTGVVYGVVRWLVFVSLLGVAGVILFALLVWFRLERTPPPEVSTRFRRGSGRLLSASVVVLLLSSAVAFVLQGAVAGGLTVADALKPDVWGEVAGTRFGLMTFVRVALLLLVGLCWRFGLGLRLDRTERSLGAAAKSRPSTLAWGAAAASVALLATPGLAGHASTTPPIALNLISDVLHLTAAAAWFGGLILLAFVAWPSSRALPGQERTPFLAGIVGRFSSVALVAVATIVVTGSFRAWMELGGLEGFLGATYGHVLLVKLIVFVPLLLLGAINNRWMLPRIKAETSSGADGSTTGRLRRLVIAEVTLSLVVLALTALLVNLPPSRVAAETSGPLVTDIALGDYDLNVIVDPNEVGANQIHLTVTENPKPVNVRAMSVLFRMPEQGIGPLRAKGRRLVKGHFVVEGRQLSVEGSWQLEIVARTSAFDEERTTMTVEVNE